MAGQLLVRALSAAVFSTAIASATVPSWMPAPDNYNSVQLVTVIPMSSSYSAGSYAAPAVVTIDRTHTRGFLFKLNDTIGSNCYWDNIGTECDPVVGTLFTEILCGDMVAGGIFDATNLPALKVSLWETADDGTGQWLPTTEAWSTVTAPRVGRAFYNNNGEKPIWSGTSPSFGGTYAQRCDLEIDLTFRDRRAAPLTTTPAPAVLAAGATYAITLGIADFSTASALYVPVADTIQTETSYFNAFSACPYPSVCYWSNHDDYWPRYGTPPTGTSAVARTSGGAWTAEADATHRMGFGMAIRSEKNPAVTQPGDLQLAYAYGTRASTVVAAASGDSCGSSSNPCYDAGGRSMDATRELTLSQTTGMAWFLENQWTTNQLLTISYIAMRHGASYGLMDPPTYTQAYTHNGTLKMWAAKAADNSGSTAPDTIYTLDTAAGPKCAVAVTLTPDDYANRMHIIVRRVDCQQYECDSMLHECIMEPQTVYGFTLEVGDVNERMECVDPGNNNIACDATVHTFTVSGADAFDGYGTVMPRKGAGAWDPATNTHTPGTVTPAMHMGLELACQAGYIVGANGCEQCPSGSYCPYGTTSWELRCPNGQTSPAGSDDISDCTTNSGGGGGGSGGGGGGGGGGYQPGPCDILDQLYLTTEYWFTPCTPASAPIAAGSAISLAFAYGPQDLRFEFFSAVAEDSAALQAAEAAGGYVIGSIRVYADGVTAPVWSATGTRVYVHRQPVFNPSTGPTGDYLYSLNWGIPRLLPVAYTNYRIEAAVDVGTVDYTPCMTSYTANLNVRSPLSAVSLAAVTGGVPTPFSSSSLPIVTLNGRSEALCGVNFTAIPIVIPTGGGGGGSGASPSPSASASAGAAAASPSASTSVGAPPPSPSASTSAGAPPSATPSPSVTPSTSPSPSPSTSPAPLPLSELRVPYLLSSADLCNATALADKVLDPSAGVGTEMRAAFASALGYGSDSAFISGLVTCNGQYIPVARDAEVNTVAVVSDVTISVPPEGRRQLRMRRLAGSLVDRVTVAVDGQTVVVELGVTIPTAIADAVATYLTATMSGASASDIAAAAAALNTAIAALATTYPDAVPDAAAPLLQAVQQSVSTSGATGGNFGTALTTLPSLIVPQLLAALGLPANTPVTTNAVPDAIAVGAAPSNGGGAPGAAQEEKSNTGLAALVIIPIVLIVIGLTYWFKPEWFPCWGKAKKASKEPSAISTDGLKLRVVSPAASHAV